MAGMEYTAPDKMLKFSRREAECYGIARYAGSDSSNSTVSSRAFSK
jgi:hypothetical protein